MKAVILAGGRGSRLSEETIDRPKPMVEMGAKPILWHIMKLYSAHGVEEFVICLGYKGYLVKEYFANYALHTSDVTFDMARGSMEVHESTTEPWRVTLVDTGEQTQTGGRLRRVARYLGDGPFCFTYGDGLSDLDIGAVIDFHREQGRLATVTPAQPPGRYGSLDVDEARVRSFREKPAGDGGWINGGVFLLEPGGGGLIEGGPPALGGGPPPGGGGGSRSSAWPSAASSPRSATAASGTRWTRCATRSSSRTCGATG